MNELLKALGPVKRRLRLQRFVSGAAWGFAGGALAALILLAVTSFVPLANRWWIAGACVAGGTLLAAAINALRPISPLEAARAADACGLRERTVTALELAETEKSTPAPPDGAGQRLADMIRLQRQDACEHLRALDAKQIRPVFLKRRLLAGALLMALCGATLLLPGDGDRAVAARQALETKTAAMAKAAEEAEKADEAGLTEKEKAELRKLTADLKRDLIASRDEADALVALDKAEQQLEKLRAEQAQEKTAGDAMSAMDAMAQAMQSAGFEAGVTESLAEALATGDANAMSSALSDLSAEDLQKLAESLTDEAKSLAEQLAEAAKQSELSESQMQALQTAAQSAQAAGTQSAMAQAAQSGQSANAQSASSMSTAQQATALQQALAGMKASLGAGQSQQSGSQASMGQGAGNNPGMSGGGAGTGSTNEEQKGGGSGQKSSGAKGTRPAEFKQTEYETIYDPEKVDAATRDVMTNQNSLGKDSVQIETGPGKGSLEGNVPYRQVVGEYAEQEARAAESANLTREQKEWVDEYFRKLTEE
jgi:chemotaxis protein histidine kinase CheA